MKSVALAVVIASSLLAAAGCGQMQTYRCVRDIVNRNEPYQNQADRDDSEALARQTCSQRAAGGSN
jgi:hypothetical protein